MIDNVDVFLSYKDHGLLSKFFGTFAFTCHPVEVSIPRMPRHCRLPLPTFHTTGDRRPSKQSEGVIFIRRDIQGMAQFFCLGC